MIEPKPPSLTSKWPTTPLFTITLNLVIVIVLKDKNHTEFSQQINFSNHTLNSLWHRKELMTIVILAIQFPSGVVLVGEKSDFGVAQKFC